MSYYDKSDLFMAKYNDRLGELFEEMQKDGFEYVAIVQHQNDEMSETTATLVNTIKPDSPEGIEPTRVLMSSLLVRLIIEKNELSDFMVKTIWDILVNYFLTSFKKQGGHEK